MHRFLGGFAPLLIAIGFAGRAAAGNFDDDGFDDVVVGAPLASVTGLGGVHDGAVYVIPGSLSGPDIANEETFVAAQFGVEQDKTAADGANFGRALASGDFDGDGVDDLAIGAPGATVDGIAGAGVVVVAYGSSQGLAALNGEVWSQNSPGIKDKVNTWPFSGDLISPTENFGKSLVTGDFNGDGFDDLAIGVNEKVGSKADAGGVQVLYGGPNGLTAHHNQLWTQDSPGVKGSAERGEEFGSVLAAADFDQDGNDDLVIATPRQTVGGKRVGVVQILRGSQHRLTSSGDKLLKAPNLESEFLVEAEFGAALATGDFDHDGFPDLAVSNPRESTRGAAPLTGSIWIFHGSASGLSKSSPTRLTQESLEILQTAPNDFGRALAAADFDLDQFADLVIGEPGQISSVGVHGGAVWIVPGAPVIDPASVKFWSQDVPGINGVGAEGDRFGAAIATVDVNGDGSPDLLVGAPDDTNDANGIGGVNCLFAGMGGIVTTLNALMVPDQFSAPGFQAPAVFGFAISN